MSELFEISYAVATNRLCLFTGTGFSKAVTDNNAPSWQGLLEDLCDLLPDSDDLKKSLFPKDKESPLSLEEIAQVISLQLSHNDKNIHEETAKIISAIELGDGNDHVSSFFTERSFRVITTNYDKMAEELAGNKKSQSITPGLPIPRSSANVKVYHVHGSVDSPDNMVLTSEDYFKFINGDSYFSRKLSTVLHENTVVILGYSLGDTNLKAIISEYKAFSKSHVIGSNIFFVSRSSVEQHVKDYYSHCYGIRVLDNLDVHDFFKKLNKKVPIIERFSDQSIKNIRKVVYKGRHFNEKFIKLEDSFYRIVSSLSAEGLSLEDERVVEVIGEVIDAKRDLTTENNAWVQYEHLARWLIYLGTILEIKGTSIEVIYLKAVLRSMNTMSNRLIVGYSWHAYKTWKNRWPSVISSNRSLIKKHVEANTGDGDALSIVNSI